MKKGFVYIGKDNECTNYYKIGVSSKPYNRERTLGHQIALYNNYYVREFECKRVAFIIESLFKKKYSKFIARTDSRGEWYLFPGFVLREVESILKMDIVELVFELTKDLQGGDSLSYKFQNNNMGNYEVALNEALKIDAVIFYEKSGSYYAGCRYNFSKMLRYYEEYDSCKQSYLYDSMLEYIKKKRSCTYDISSISSRLNLYKEVLEFYQVLNKRIEEDDAHIDNCYGIKHLLIQLLTNWNSKSGLNYRCFYNESGDKAYFNTDGIRLFPEILLYFNCEDFQPWNKDLEPDSYLNLWSQCKFNHRFIIRILEDIISMIENNLSLTVQGIFQLVSE